MSSTAPQPPASIGPYPVEKELGRGGMGVVYLARDPKLGRQVAIKVLPAAFTQDPQRLQRFEREARTLAALNHRNVAMIFGLEQDQAEQRLLVLEFVPGVALTQKLSRGGLPLDEALRLCIQIAEGLEAAHEIGIVHRDLKPDNVRVTPEEIAKILDFGLATAKPPAEGMGEDAAAGSALTVQGMVMGTPGYMSPEQARGQPTDRRADIWAFGCVLFESLCGYKAFGGETVGDAIAAILEREPDFSLLPARTPSRLRELIRRCLIKDSRRRLRDIGDARIELEEVLTQPQSGWYRTATDAGARPRSVARLVLPLNAGANAALGFANAQRSNLAISPDGSAVAFVAAGLAGSGGGIAAAQPQLYTRRLDAHEARPVPNAAGAEGPFFSPDGTRLGFFQGGRLMRVALTGGAPVPLAPAPRQQGACWDEGDFIYFIPDWQKPLMRIPAAGGTPESVAQPDLAAGELAFLSPEVLPGSRHILLTVWTGHSVDDALISAIDLRTGQRRPLVHGGCNPRYLASGHIVFSRGSDLLAVGFDPEKLEIFGQPMPVQDGVMSSAIGGGAQFAAGADGTLVFAAGGVWKPSSGLLIAGRAGETTPLATDAQVFTAPAVSPDSKRLAVQVQGVSDQIFIYDLEKPGAGVKVTFHADNACPVWSPDGSRVVFRSNMSGKPELYHIAVDAGGAAGAPELIFSADDRVPTPTSCAEVPGMGRVVAFTLTRPPPKGGTEVWTVRVGDPSSARVAVDPPTSAWGASLSPDGKLIAYVSDETGRPEIYAQQFAGAPGGAGGGARRQVSAEGGLAPVWSRQGGELFFRQGEQIVAVRIAVEPNFMVGRPRPFAVGTCVGPSSTTGNYDALPDGQRFVMVRSQEDRAGVGSLSVVLNWFEELRRRVPVPERAIPVPSQMGAPPTRASQMGMTQVPTRSTASPATRGSSQINTQMPTQMPAHPHPHPPPGPSPNAPTVV